MKNSPICQYLVAQTLQLMRDTYPNAYIIHYMDDILLANTSQLQLDKIFSNTVQQLQNHGLIISVEKIQCTEPFNYLDYPLIKNKVKPQKMSIRMDFIKTLNDFQKLLGNINWLRTSLGIPTYALQNLFKTLERPSDLNSSRHLTSEAKQKLKLVKKRIAKAFVRPVRPNLPIFLYVFPIIRSPTAVISQKETSPLKWVYLHSKQAKKIVSYFELIGTIVHQGHTQTLTGYNPDGISIPISNRI